MRTPDIGTCIEIKNGKHRGELGIVVQVIAENVLKVLTLEGDYHYLNSEGYEAAK